MAAKKRGAGASWLPDTCSSTELATILGISTRSVREWTQKGALVPATAKGRYQTLPSVHGYIKSLREQAAGRATKNGRVLADERANLAHTQNKITELKYAQMRGDVMTLDEVSDSWSSFAAAVKAAVLALPGKARSSIPHITAHDAEVLKRICRDSLIDLAEEVEAVVVMGDPKDVEP